MGAQYHNGHWYGGGQDIDIQSDPTATSFDPNKVPTGATAQSVLNSNFVKITSTPGLLCGNTSIAASGTKELTVGNWKRVHCLYIRVVYGDTSAQCPIFVPVNYLLLHTGNFSMRFPIIINGNAMGNLIISAYTDTTITVQNGLSSGVSVAVWGSN